MHTDDIGAAIEAGIEVGRPRDIRVTDLVEQVQARGGAGCASTVPPTTCRPSGVTTAVVAVAVGDGLRRLFAGSASSAVVAGGQSMNPSTARILEAVDAAPADGVIVLPNNKNIVPVAEQVPGLTDLPVAVVPTTSVVEALAALLAYDPPASLGRQPGRHVGVGDRVRPARSPGGARQRGGVRTDRDRRLDRHRRDGVLAP